MSVYLREKAISNGRVSFYLDINHNGSRWTEFLEIYTNKKRPTDHDKELRLKAKEIRAKRESQLIDQNNGLIDRSYRKADFVEWFTNYANSRPQPQYRNTLSYLKRFQEKKPLLFQAFTPVWIRDFTNFLLPLMHNNTARQYIKSLDTALREAEKLDIIRKNPFRLVDKKDRLKLKKTFRQAYTIEELQRLASTSTSNKMTQQMKQAYFFSCFSGLRWSDVNPLKWSQVITKCIDGVQQWFIYFQQEKTEDIEYFPLSDQAIAILKAREQNRGFELPSLYVFPEIKETNKNGTMNRTINRYLKIWAEAAGLNPKDMKFHTSRHTFATNVLEHSVEGDLWTVSKLLGHKSIQATQIYAHVRDSRKMAAVKALPTLSIAMPLTPNILLLPPY